MNLEENKWAFTEFLGQTDDVKKAILALKDANVLHGSVSSNEEKGDKRFVQCYTCNTNVCPLTEEEAQIYNEIALRFHVSIEYAFMGRDCQYFPDNGNDDFPIKYWEWWVMK